MEETVWTTNIKYLVWPFTEKVADLGLVIKPGRTVGHTWQQVYLEGCKAGNSRATSAGVFAIEPGLRWVAQKPLLPQGTYPVLRISQSR